PCRSFRACKREGARHMAKMPKFDAQRAANAMPERMRLDQHWEFGQCKRCLTNHTKAGDVIVRVYGQGWWHDDCYRVVNPKFYDGSDPPGPPPSSLPEPAASQDSISL